MSYLLRMTKCNKWIIENYDWLEEGDIPADPIFGLNTKNNTMSVWMIDSYEGQQFERTVAALAANRDILQDFEYVLLDSEVLEFAGIENRQNRGESPDQELSKFHFDLIEISGQKLVKLTASILRKIEQEGEDTKRIDRISKKKVAKYIIEGIKQGHIDPEDVKSKVIKKAHELMAHSAEQISS